MLLFKNDINSYKMGRLSYFIIIILAYTIYNVDNSGHIRGHPPFLQLRYQLNEGNKKSANLLSNSYIIQNSIKSVCCIGGKYLVAGGHDQEVRVIDL